MQIASFDSSDQLNSPFFVIVFLLNEEILERNLCVTYAEFAFIMAFLPIKFKDLCAMYLSNLEMAQPETQLIISVKSHFTT